MREYWDDTLSSEESGNRREYGFTIKMRVEPSTSPEYSFIDGNSEVVNECGEGAVNTIVLSVDDTEMSGGGNYSVAFFHTHPPLTNCPSTSSRGTGVSERDNMAANENKIPSIVMDYESSEICGGHFRYLPYKLYYAGNYQQRQ